MTKKEIINTLYLGTNYSTIYKNGRSWEISTAQNIAGNFEDCMSFSIPCVDFKTKKSAKEWLEMQIDQHYDQKYNY